MINKFYLDKEKDIIVNLKKNRCWWNYIYIRNTKSQYRKSNNKFSKNLWTSNTKK